MFQQKIDKNCKILFLHNSQEDTVMMMITFIISLKDLIEKKSHSNIDSSFVHL